MIIQLDKGVEEGVLSQVKEELHKYDYIATPGETQFGSYLVGTGSKHFDIRSIGHLKGIKDIHIVSDNYKLVSRKWKVSDTQIDLGDGIKIGASAFAIMAGPCSIEGEENIKDTIRFLKENNITIMRGGVYKPRSSHIRLEVSVLRDSNYGIPLHSRRELKLSRK